MRTVDEVVAGWTPEEQEKLKDLIEECQQREADNLENRRRRDKALKALVDDELGRVAEAVYTITKRRGGHDGNA